MRTGIGGGDGPLSAEEEATYLEFARSLALSMFPRATQGDQFALEKVEAIVDEVRTEVPAT